MAINYFKQRDYKFFVRFILLFIYALFIEGFSQDGNLYNNFDNNPWSITSIVKDFSANGKWALIEEIYETKDNQLVLIHCEKGYQKRFSRIKKFKLGSNNPWFITQNKDNQLSILNLNTDERRIIKDVENFEISKSEKLLAFFVKNDSNSSLIILDLHTNKEIKIRNVEKFQWNPINDTMLYVLNNKRERQIFLLNSSFGKRKIFNPYNFESSLDINWSKNGNKVIIQENIGNSKNLNIYSLDNKSYSLKSVDVENKFIGEIILNKPIFISDMGDRIYFYKGKIENEIQKDMEVWDTKDKWIYPRMIQYLEEINGILTMWKPESGELIEISDMETPSVQFNPNHDYAILSNKLEHEPQHKQYQNVDIYLKDFISGEKTLITSRQYNAPYYVTLSPNGQYIAFFQQNNWFVFDVKNQKTTNLTQEIDSNFQDVNDWLKDEKKPQGRMGWTKDENFIVVHDEFDVWLISLDGSVKRKITNGKNTRIRHRINVELERNKIGIYAHSLHNGSFEFDLDEGIIIETLGEDLKTGFGYFSYEMGFKNIIYNQEKISHIFSDKTKNYFIYFKEYYNKSPSLYFNDNSGNEKLLVQSNLDLKNIDLGKMELITYSTFKNTNQKAVLIYPANYNSALKYPMITCVYENKYTDVFNFRAPSYFNQTGFNILNYVMNGYFVFLPGIDYELGKPGDSAVQSIEAAIKASLKNPSIDSNRLGLIGHSFGGYETAYIMTRSNLFATGVAGGVVSDFESYYHDVQWNGWGTEQMWRMEDHIFRLGKGFYEDKERYRNNSPLEHVESLKNPLLIWVGKNDYNTNWYQSLFLFMGMKRLNKEGKFLLLNNEAHVPLKLENRKDLTIEIFNWMEKYLKN